MTNFNTSLVSVVVAVKNEEKHFSEAINSILIQKDVNLELVCIDDCSSDRTYEIAQEIGRKDHRLKIYKNTKSGKCSAFNLGIKNAKGDYVCIFAGDDLMPMDSLRLRLDVIEPLGQSQPVIGLSKIVTMSKNKKFDGYLIPRARGVGALSGVSPLMNRKALDLVFPVPEVLPNEDTWMELAALHLHEIHLVHSDVIACKWRVHSGNSINMMVPFDEYNKKITARMKALPLFLEKFKDDIEINQSKILAAKIRCEANRVRGDMMGVMFSGASLVDRLRALSITNRFLFFIRKTFYGLLSGW